LIEKKLLYMQVYVDNGFYLSFNRMENLIQLFVQTNQLNGSIPSGIKNLTFLSYLVLSDNKLTGSIPSAIGSCSQLQAFKVNNNRLSGSFPDRFADLTALLFVTVENNYLTGTFPSFLLKSNLGIIRLSDNYFNGTLPDTIGEMTSVFILDIMKNRFSGTLPSSIGSMTGLFNLYISKNHFRGSIPSEIGYLTNLNAFHFDSNSLANVLPASITACVKLTELSMYGNYIQGSLPAGISNLRNLILFLAQYNRFTGPFALSPLQNQLISFDVSGNAFTGTLPESLFPVSSKLISIAAVDNCFRGSIPSSICQATSLISIVLDGLSSSSKYIYSRFSPLFFSLYITYSLSIYGRCKRASNLYGGEKERFMTGSIPSCLWSLPNLVTLHIAGNGLSGRLPESGASISKSLLHINMQFNQISGTISEEINNISFAEFDFSHNKITGTISGERAPVNLTSVVVANTTSSSRSASLEDTRYYLSVNRLSGTLSDRVGISAFDSLSILNGNLFACNVPDKISSDVEYDTYACGSEDLDRSIASWGAGILLFCAVVLSIALIHRRTVRRHGGGGGGGDETADGHKTIASRVRGAEEDGSALKASESHTAAVAAETIPAKSTDVGVSSSGSVGSEYGLVHQHMMAISGFARQVIVWYGVKDDPRYIKLFPKTAEFLKMLQNLRMVALYIALCCLVVSVVLYSSMKVGDDSHTYKTHTFQFSWLISAAYLTGNVPAFCLFLVYFALGLMLVMSVYRLKPPQNSSAEKAANLEKPTDIDSERSEKKSSDFSEIVNQSKLLTLRFGYMATLVGVIMMINVLYVVARLTLSLSALQAVQFAFTLVTVLWMSIVIPLSINKVNTVLSLNAMEISRFRSWLTTISAIIAPALATLGSDSLCFRDLILGTESIESSYSSIGCLRPQFTKVDLSCIESFKLRPNCTLIDYSTFYCEEYVTIELTNSFKPPFIYNNMCSSALLTNYVPIILYSNLYTSVIAPMIYIALMWADVKGVPEAIRRILPPVLWPSDGLQRVHQESIIVSVMVNMATLLTFGIASPPVALAVGVSVFLQTLFWTVVIGRSLQFNMNFDSKDKADKATNDSCSVGVNDSPNHFEGESVVTVASSLSNTLASSNSGALNPLQKESFPTSNTCSKFTLEPINAPDNSSVESIERSCSNSHLHVVYSLWPAVIISALFFSLIILDMASDEYIAGISFWPFILTLLSPIILWQTNDLYERSRNHLRLQKSTISVESKNLQNVELSNF
jgi:Leucine-rich repeat (LRR) protein